MSIACAVFIATSLDGYIARSDGGTDWLDAANATIPDGEDCGYGSFMSAVDALVMGSGTFDKLLSFAEWPYGDKPVWVVSRRRDTLPAHLPATVSLTGKTPGQIVEEARQLGYRRLYIDGGQLIQSFLREGLISELTITTIPVLLGGGRPLFGTLNEDVQLELLASRSYPCGFVQSRYRVGKAGA